MNVRFAAAGFATMATLVLGATAAIAQPPPPAMPAPVTAKSATAPTAAAPPSDDCGPCGRIVSIKQTTSKQSWTPLGAGVGVGGAPDLGSTPSAVTNFQIGPGLSNQGLVIIGAAGGASYRRSPNSYEQPRWEVTVKLDSGQTRVVTLSYEPYVQQGDRVRVAGNNVELVE